MPLHGQNSWRREKFGDARFSMLKRRPPSAVLLRGRGNAALHGNLESADTGHCFGGFKIAMERGVSPSS